MYSAETKSTKEGWHTCTWRIIPIPPEVPQAVSCYYMLYAANYNIDFSDSSFSTDQDYLFASPSQVLIAS